jgi:hypothetical protein
MNMSDHECIELISSPWQAGPRQTPTGSEGLEQGRIRRGTQIYSSFSNEAR